MVGKWLECCTPAVLDRLINQGPHIPGAKLASAFFWSLWTFETIAATLQPVDSCDRSAATVRGPETLVAMEPRGSLDQPYPGFTIVDNEGVSLRVERRKTVNFDNLGAAGLGHCPPSFEAGELGGPLEHPHSRADLLKVPQLTLRRPLATPFGAGAAPHRRWFHTPACPSHPAPACPRVLFAVDEPGGGSIIHCPSLRDQLEARCCLPLPAAAGGARPLGGARPGRATKWHPPEARARAAPILLLQVISLHPRKLFRRRLW